MLAVDCKKISVALGQFLLHLFRQTCGVGIQGGIRLLPIGNFCAAVIVRPRQDIDVDLGHHGFNSQLAQLGQGGIQQPHRGPTHFRVPLNSYPMDLHSRRL